MADELVEELKAHVGDALRVVGTYSRYEQDALFVRDDLVEDIDDAHLSDVHDSMIFEDIGQEYAERTFEAGDLDCVSYHLTDALLFHLVSEEFDGVFVSIDRDATQHLPELVEVAKRYS